MPSHEDSSEAWNDDPMGTSSVATMVLSSEHRKLHDHTDAQITRNRQAGSPAKLWCLFIPSCPVVLAPGTVLDLLC